MALERHGRPAFYIHADINDVEIGAYLGYQKRGFAWLWHSRMERAGV